ncbi:C1 family peptidase [Pseudomonas huaxiensis]|uniref:C1 family peptidase n=1 Tax=Pseudomonas huaxiensis TaxID=2213017 RepID=UPI000DA6AE60|nr:C1 family peptidase [Pseudomonas huaxiensis]
MSPKNPITATGQVDLAATVDSPWLTYSGEIPPFNPEPQVFEKVDLRLQSRFEMVVFTEVAAFLPYVPDLSKLAPPKNQGESKACTSYAIASAIEDRMLLANPSAAFPVSPLFAHVCVGRLDTSSPWDPYFAMQDLGGSYLVRETATDSTDFPGQCALRKGQIRLTNIRPIEGDLEARRAVQQGPVIAVMELWEDFHSANYKGELYRSKGGAFGGYHTVEVVGFDASGWIIKNSFGPKWGNRGFGKVAYGECLLFRDSAYSFQPVLI